MTKKRAEYLAQTKKYPYKFNALKKEQWLEAYTKTGSITHACRSIGISRFTVHLVLKSDKEFLAKKEDVDNMVDDTVENRLFENTKKNVIAQIFWLCNRRKGKWQNSQKTEVTGKDGDPIQFIIQDAKRK